MLKSVRNTRRTDNDQSRPERGQNEYITVNIRGKRTPKKNTRIQINNAKSGQATQEAITLDQTHPSQKYIYSKVTAAIGK